MAEKREPAEKAKKPARRHLFRRIFRYFCLFLLLLVLCAGGALYWITQTENGHAWLLKTVNAALTPTDPEASLGFRLTDLSGSIPFNFEFALESSDQNGVWLAAPKNRFVWNWKKLPGEINIEFIGAENVDIERFPDLAPKKEEKPTEPLTLADIRHMLEAVADFLGKRHWWLPDLTIGAIKADALLPQTLLPAPDGKEQRLRADLALGIDFIDNKAKVAAQAVLKNAIGEPISTEQAAIDSASLDFEFVAAPADKALNAGTRLSCTLTKPVLSIADVPPDIAGDAATFSLGLNAVADLANPGLEARLIGPNIEAGHLSLNGSGHWHTSHWQENSLDGPLDYKLALELAPVSVDSRTPLASIRAPLRLDLNVKGDLPVLDLELALDCSEARHGELKITDASVRLSGKEIKLPDSQQAIAALETENRIALDLGAKINGYETGVKTDLFFQRLEEESGWRAGLRNLNVNIPGIDANGALAALLPPAGKPGIDGTLQIGIRNMAELEKFLPGQKLAGSAEIAISMASQAPAGFANIMEPVKKVFPRDATLRQDAQMELSIPAFTLRQKDGSRIEANAIKGRINLEDLFADPAIKADIALGSLAAAGLKLSANIKANGSLRGPLKADISSKGSINSRIDAQWQPGEAKIAALDVSADLSKFLGNGKKRIVAGIRSSQSATITYGEKGIGVSGLDLHLQPGGRLRANGSLAPDKLDFNLSLENLELKTWQAVVPQLPSGSASLTATLKGTPKIPSGNFNLGLHKLIIPGNTLPPVSLSLKGAIQNSAAGSRLNASLEMDPQTVKAFGGNVAQITASLPLIFGDDGVPKPNMEGPLVAKVRWDGALGPIWNLLPIADRRLNGRVEINLDAGGTLSKPRINGFAAINQARYEDLVFGVLLTDINLRVDLTDAGAPAQRARGAIDGLPGRMSLALSVSDGLGGSLKANGGGSINGENLDIKIKITDLKPLRRRDIHVQLSGDLQATGSALSPQVKGKVIVDKGEVLLDNLSMTSSVTTLDITDAKAPKRPPKAAAPAPKGSGSLDIRFVMLPRFSIEGRGLASIWQANLLINGPLTDPRVTGNINCVRGNFDFLGKLFALSKGIVFFGGGSIANPLVDIDLAYNTQDLTANIIVEGPVNKLKITLTSDPIMPRDEILSRVLFGRSVNDLSRMEALQLAGAVAQLAGFGGGSGILSSAKKALGVDVLRIGTSNSGGANQTSDESGGGTTIEAGKYINDFIYMGVQQGFKADSTAFIIEIELTPNLNLELRTEQSNTWGGIKWKKNY